MAITNEEFIHRCRLRHGDKYDYSEVVYTKMHSRIPIICPVHGVFRQRAYVHVQGGGCPSCSYEGRAKRQSLTFEEVLRRFRDTHGSRYDYSMVEYEGTKKPVHILCPDHGSFWQSPQNHFNGCHCPVCAEISRVRLEGPATLYYARVETAGGTYWKVGVTGQEEVRNRFRGILQTTKVTILLEETYASSEEAFEVEQNILRAHDDDRVVATWAGTSGKTECFRRNVLGL